MKQILAKSKSFIAPAEFEELVKDLQLDWRLRLANKQAFVNVQPDGWVSKKAVVKLRYSAEDPRILRLVCKGGWPIEGYLNLKITSSNGTVEKVKLGSQDEFTLILEAPRTESNAFVIWTIETTQTFIPAQTIKKSRDNRALSFKVEALSLV